MFGIGIQELLLIFIVALIFLGPKKLPEIAKSLGRATREFRKASQDFKTAIGLDEETDTRSSKSKEEACDLAASASLNEAAEKKSEKKDEELIKADGKGAENVG